MLSRLFAIALFTACAFCVSISPAVEEPKDKDKPKEKAKEKGKPNKLAKESSPYLLQHAYNPVNWYPWGPEAFEKAKKEKKLIFLSIGYSSCHWCHVMERESFSNADIAKILNDNFVCIKVDREERPDIDDIYMTALNVTGIDGGWPLSMFLTPEGKPIFGGTYFPPEDKKVGDDTITGFKTVLNKVIEFDKDRADLLKQADIIAEKTVDALEANSRLVALVPINRELVSDALEFFDIDPEHGGTGSKARMYRGTKFPRPPVWSFLLSQSNKPGNEALKKKVTLTLTKMLEGGIYDQLGGGFHRYSTERTWTVPHFEKMLYDNAQLVELYSEAFALDARPEYKRVVTETLGFIKREMTSPEGGFYSALDADTNHNEGEFYVWTLAEIKKILGNDADTALIRAVYGIGAPNFEEKFHILRLPKPLAELAKEQKLTEAELLAKLEPLKKKLFDARAKRARPFLDTKIIAAWNGQMIAGYAKAGQVFKNKDYTDAAAKAADFILTKMSDKDGRLFRIFAAVPGEKPSAKVPAFIDDYGYMIHGLLNLHDATSDKKWLDAAKQLTDLVVKWYGDPVKSGFYFTASDAEKLFARAKDSYDGVQPSGNAQMARNLLRLWQKTKDDTYRDRSIRTVKAYALALKMNPTSMPAMLRCLDELLDAAGEPEKPAPKDKPDVKRPKESADVVSSKLTLDPAKDGKRAFTLALEVEAPWHLYANPVGLELLAESQTEVTVFVGGKKVDAKIEYPKGKAITDSTGSKYAVYEGVLAIKGSFPYSEGEVEVRVKIVACKEGTCLKPSMLKLK
ncbi:MAG: thioredoxin domain-containing protein [Planctomycetia bacterium]|nr:thioredoxin domain-containing protein [Planctomycetia bacterium]